MESAHHLKKYKWRYQWTPWHNFSLPHLYNAENDLENIDLEEVELIYPEVTYTSKDFSDDFKEFADFNLEGFNIDNESLDAAIFEVKNYWLLLCY